MLLLLNTSCLLKQLHLVRQEDWENFLQKMASRLIAVDFEIFGIVQGVSFRAYTKRQALKLGLSGWVQNTVRDTVIGSLQGEFDRVNEMKEWLKNTGSPVSRIDKAVFSNEHPIERITFNGFVIKE